MGALKLKVVVIPIQFAGVPHSGVSADISRKFLHLASPNSTLKEVQQDLLKRFKRLYKTSEDLDIEFLQDEECCDLDTQFKVSDVFQNGDVLRVIISNELQPLHANRTLNGTFSDMVERTPQMLRSIPINHQSQSTPIPSAAPVFGEHTILSSSSKKRTQDFFETSNHNIPSKLNRTNKSGSIEKTLVSSFGQDGSLSIKKRRSEKDTDVSLGQKRVIDESDITLPPPEESVDRKIPVKHDFPNASGRDISSRQVSSGMLNLPLHTQLENDRIRKQKADSRDLSNGSIIIADITNTESESEADDLLKSFVKSTPVGTENIEKDTSDAMEVDDVTLSKEEIISIFKNKMKLPARLRGKFANDKSKILPAIMKNLEIDMVGGNPVIPPSTKRTTRQSSKAINSDSNSQDSNYSKMSNVENKPNDVTSSSASHKSILNAQNKVDLAELANTINGHSNTTGKPNTKLEQSRAEGVNSKSADAESKDSENDLSSDDKSQDMNSTGKEESNGFLATDHISLTNASSVSNGRYKTVLNDLELDQTFGTEKETQTTNQNENNQFSASREAVYKNSEKKAESYGSSSRSSSSSSSEEESDSDEDMIAGSAENGAAHAKKRDLKDLSIASSFATRLSMKSTSTRPRLAGDITSNSNSISENKTRAFINKGSMNIKNDSMTLPLLEGKSSKLEPDFVSNVSKSPVKSPRVIQNVRKSNKPALRSLSDLALRGVPDVESNHKPSIFDPQRKDVDYGIDANNVDSQVVSKDSESESSESDSDSDSSSDSNGSDESSDSSSESESSQKFISINSMKKKKKKKNGGFFALMKDAKKF